ncbi:MAG: hypothetical protein ACLSE8_15575 [Parasutterella sp.]
MQTVCSTDKRMIEEPDVDLFFKQFASKMRICDLQRKVSPDELCASLIQPSATTGQTSSLWTP